MEWSDDNVIQTIMDIKSDTNVIKSELGEVKDCQKKHGNRLKKLENVKKINAVKKGGIWAGMTAVALAVLEFLRWLRGG